MRVVRNSNGNTTVKMSKEEWRRMGERANWFEEEKDEVFVLEPIEKTFEKDEFEFFFENRYDQYMRVMFREVPNGCSFVYRDRAWIKNGEMSGFSDDNFNDLTIDTHAMVFVTKEEVINQIGPTVTRLEPLVVT